MSLRLLLHAQNRFARFVTWVSLIGLTLGVMILTLVVTVMNGFDYELRQRVLGSVPHLTINEFDHPQSMLERIEKDDRVLSLGRFYQGMGAISKKGRIRPVSIVAVDANDSDVFGLLQDAMVVGRISDLSLVDSGVVMGQPLARYFGLDIGDSLMVAVTKPRGDSVVLETIRLNLIATFELGADPDYSMLLLNLADKEIGQWRSMGRLGMQLQLTDPMLATDMVAWFSSQYPKVQLTTWIEDFGELFQAVQLEKAMMFILLLLVVAIAGFNIVAGQFMMVNDKRADIAILRTLGATQSFILGLFLIQGTLISFLGTMGGLILGLVLAENINVLVDFLAYFSGKHLLDGSYFVTVPVRVLYLDLFIIAAVSGTLALSSAWMPAKSASQLDPAQNLR
jgi:lipoprotein-releasing system permease protein